MTRSTRAAILVIYLGLSAVILARFLYGSANSPYGIAAGEIEVRLAYDLLILGFPASIIGLFVAPSSPILQWLLFSVVGFVQWVILFPRAVSWVRCRWRVREGRQVNPRD